MSQYEQIVLGPVEKYPWEEFRFALDFGPWIGADPITSQEVKVFTMADVDQSATMVGATDFVGTWVRAMWKAGTVGTSYYVRHRITTVAGKRFEARVQIDVVDTKLAT